MRKRTFISLLSGLVVIALCVVATRSDAAENGDRNKPRSLNKTTTNDLYTEFTINNLFNFYSNTGDGSVNPVTGNSGFEYPKGSGKTATFEDGVVWGGFHKGRSIPKVGGSTYHRGLQAGVILTPGGPLDTQPPTADDPTLAKYRPYRVRPDVTPTTPFADVKDKLDAEAALIGRFYSTASQSLYNQYVKDWNEWPAKDGLPAPYTDVNHDGKYDPAVDIPGQPGADQTIYYVANDCNSSLAQSLYGSPTIGLEMHRTIWGYNQSGALGNTIFESTLIINKSGAPLDSAFLVQWADVDLGDAGDDYAGCDVARNLGFTYNGGAVDATYGKAVPATGYTFFQGPVVKTGAPGDTAIFRLHKVSGARNLQMTTFVFFINSNATYSDPPFGTGGDVDWYRLMNGLISGTGGPFVNPLTHQAVKYTLDGDPVAGSGWLDGTFGLVPGDRRQCSVSGPFTLADGDTQEVVVAHLVGLGNDRISSVAVMKWYSDLAQTDYNSLFNIPFPPPTPKPQVSALDGEIALNWKDTLGCEHWNSGGYQFEGYNVYQFNGPSADITAGVRLTTYDLINSVTTIFDDVYDPGTGYIISKPVEFGFDTGIKRSFDTKTDAVKSAPLRDGSHYYYGVTSYSFKSGAKPSHLESAPDLIDIVPQAPNPGVRYGGAYGDTIGVAHTAGVSDGSVLARVVNPQALTGKTYKIVFTQSGSNTYWNVVRISGSQVDTVAKNQSDQTGVDAGSVLVDGMQIQVTGAPQSFTRFLVVSNKNGALNPPQQGAFAFNGSGFPFLADGVTDRPDGTKQQSASAGLGVSMGWGIGTGMNSPTMDPGIAQFVSRVTQGGARWSSIIPYDFEIRFTAAGSQALFPADFSGNPDRLVHVPFELWNIGIGTPNDPSDDYQMFANILDVDGNYLFNLLTQAGVDSVDNGGGGADHTISGGTNDPFTDWFYWVKPTNTAPGHAGYDAIVDSVTAEIASSRDAYLGGATNNDVLRRMVLIGWNFGNVDPGVYPEQMPEQGTVFRIITGKPSSTSDVFTFTAPTTASTQDAAKADVTKLNVFPNPYIGFNPQERDKYNRFVTFSHLPTSATIRIFNLAGVLVRTLTKNTSSQFLQWDLKNESGFPVAAGMYIVYVDMGALGTKTLKLGVIPEQQYIDRW